MEYIKEIKETDLETCENAASFLQSSMWGEFKSRFGWAAKAFKIDWEGYGAISLLLLSRRLAPGFSFAYIPWGPELPSLFPAGYRCTALTELAEKLKPLLSVSTGFIRFEPPWFTENDKDMSLITNGLKRAASTVQAPDTVIVNLDSPAAEILGKMKSKWRYNISLAEKKGVKVKRSGAQELDFFYTLLKETAARDRIALHSIDYYKTLFEICMDKKDLQLSLYVASHENDKIAAIVVLFRREYATYLYGASSNSKRNLMAPYALQWRAIQDAKEAGCQYYDLFGIPPDDNPNHPMAGLFRFKTGFGGEIIHRFGSLDYPYKSFLYNLFSFAEAVRKKLRNLKKRSSK